MKRFFVQTDKLAILKKLERIESQEQPADTDWYHKVIRRLLKKVYVEGYSNYDPAFGDGKICKCGHEYYRHFDSYEDMRPVGCKYCRCNRFREVEQNPTESPPT